MRIKAMMLAAILAPSVVTAQPPASAGRFDGAWTATVSCPDASGALGFAFDVPATVADGVFHGERLKPGEPGWLVIDGPITPDGRAKLYARGLVGAAQFAVGQRPEGTPYGYHIDARFFEEGRGEGDRIEGRRCHLAFSRR